MRRYGHGGGGRFPEKRQVVFGIFQKGEVVEREGGGKGENFTLKELALSKRSPMQPGRMKKRKKIAWGLGDTGGKKI